MRERDEQWAEGAGQKRVERGGDLILPQGEYALVQDNSSGDVYSIVGPTKQSLADTDIPVRFNSEEKRFVPCNKMDAVQAGPAACEGEYIVLVNPCQDNPNNHPEKGKQRPIDLEMGRKMNIPGPADFALYPRQVAEVIPGHQLASNQYLVIRVYNEAAAASNWSSAIVKKADAANGDSDVDNADKVQANTIPDLTTGKLLIVTGTDVAYYIPPTGVEVMQDDMYNKYVRDAVSLERLEYCILLDENGEKRYVEGPAVVFPRPTERFIKKNESRVFKAIELNENMGIHVKVLDSYEDEIWGKLNKGDEVFITGDKQRIYFPRAEHAIIKYGNPDPVQYAIAIPKGEARYVLDKTTGEVKLINGPKMFLPNPTNQVIVKRALDNGQVDLLYPGNSEAKAYNQNLSQHMSGMQPATCDAEYETTTTRSLYSSKNALESYDTDNLSRKTKFTEPRSITLNTKYEGVPRVSVWTGYAVQVVSSTGEKKVVVGPTPVLLEYDEGCEALSLSTGKPKTTDRLLKTAYLRVKNNKVSDIISAETADLVQVSVKLSYRVDFDGDYNKWFDVENYVKFLCDHMRSIVRNAVKSYGIEEFNANSINIIRDTILGEKLEDENGNSSRTGRVFTENGMKIKDVEVLGMTIGDDRISDLLVMSQRNTVRRTLEMVESEQDLNMTKKSEAIKRGLSLYREETTKLADELEALRLSRQADLVDEQLKREEAQQTVKNKIASEERDREYDSQKARLENRKDVLEAETESFVKKFAAVDDKLIAALEGIGNRELATELARNLPKANGEIGYMLAGGGFEGLKKMFAGSKLEGCLDTYSTDGAELVQ